MSPLDIIPTMSIIAHGDWITLGLWLVWMVVQFAGWLVVIAVVSLLAGLLYGPLLLMLVRRGRHLLWLMPLVNVGAFFLLNPATRASQLTGLPQGILHTSGWLIAAICGLIAATFVGSTARVVRRGRDHLAAPSEPLPATGPPAPSPSVEPTRV